MPSSSTNTPISEKLRLSGGSSAGEPVSVYAVDAGVLPGATSVTISRLTWPQIYFRAIIRATDASGSPTYIPLSPRIDELGTVHSGDLVGSKPNMRPVHQICGLVDVRHDPGRGAVPKLRMSFISTTKHRPVTTCPIKGASDLHDMSSVSEDLRSTRVSPHGTRNDVRHRQRG